MPTYDYVCDGCGHKFEEMQSFSADPLKECPECHELKLRRLFGTGAAILFKGGGFYETDYRSEGYKSAAKADTSSTTPPASTGSTTPAAAPAPSSTPSSSGDSAK
jgi:putative FmdB family regulatory protein